MKVTQSTWPEKQHIGVIFDYRANEAQVAVLARTAGEGAFITVLDARSPEQAHAAATALTNENADFVVLMPSDRNFRDGSFGVTIAVNRLASRGVPAIGTSPKALLQGAVFSVGDRTEGQILVNTRLIGTVDVILPRSDLASQSRTRPSRPQAPFWSRLIATRRKTEAEGYRARSQVAL